MASILQIGTKWRALVRRKGFRGVAKTFPTKAQAQAWARQVEAEIDMGRAPPADLVADRTITVGELIRVYRRLMADARPISDKSSEHYMLKTLDLHLGNHDAQRLTIEDLEGFCRVRAEEGAGPYTVNMDVSKLGTVMRYAGASLRLDLPDVVHKARPLLSHLGLIGDGGRRERRPTEDELLQVLTWLADNKGVEYCQFVTFAVLTAMRRGEIAKLMWDDVDTKNRMVLVRQRKDPRKKTTNDQWVPLLGSAWDILQAQPRYEGVPCIFPVHPQTVSKYFREACAVLGIPDLRLHDMRHDGTSRLFEEGYRIEQVAMVSGHKKWETLKRYTNLRPEDLHHGPAGEAKAAKARKAAAKQSAAKIAQVAMDAANRAATGQTGTAAE
ncbi:tyrosine-type recombinase/integrase [Comamonas resistens]|uniref:tyrosine-type recombinase/integrase n=1 Tax=Comamonas resistens TaxID=3046670 RepID=UPI0039BC8810